MMGCAWWSFCLAACMTRHLETRLQAVLHYLCALPTTLCAFRAEMIPPNCLDCCAISALLPFKRKPDLRTLAGCLFPSFCPRSNTHTRPRSKMHAPAPRPLPFLMPLPLPLSLSCRTSSSLPAPNTSTGRASAPISPPLVRRHHHHPRRSKATALGRAAAAAN